MADQKAARRRAHVWRFAVRPLGVRAVLVADLRAGRAGLALDALACDVCAPAAWRARLVGAAAPAAVGMPACFIAWALGVDLSATQLATGVALSVLYRLHLTFWSLLGGVFVLFEKDRVTRADVAREVERERSGDGGVA